MQYKGIGVGFPKNIPHKIMQYKGIGVGFPAVRESRIYTQ
jgi:hypothetical protein